MLLKCLGLKSTHIQENMESLTTLLALVDIKVFFLNNGILRKWNTMCTVLEKKTDQEQLNRIEKI